MNDVNADQLKAVDDRIWSSLQLALNDIAQQAGYAVFYNDIEPGFKVAQVDMYEDGKNLSVNVFYQYKLETECYTVQIWALYPFLVRPDAMDEAWRYFAHATAESAFTSYTIRKVNNNPYCKMAVLLPCDEAFPQGTFVQMFIATTVSALDRYEDVQRFAA